MNRIELDNRAKAVKILNGLGWHAMPVENKAHDGTPDLNACRDFRTSPCFSCGMDEMIEMWIEFKIVEEWPKRETTAIKIRHFSPQQKNWLKFRIKHNPNCYIIIQIEEEHFLYQVGLNTIECLGTSWTKHQMKTHSLNFTKDLKELLIKLDKRITS